MRVMGLDPGLGATGYGLVDSDGQDLQPIAFGVITTKPDCALAVRLFQLHQQLHELLVRFSPNVVVIEQLFFGNNSRTAIVVGQARGVLLLATAENNLPTAEYTPIQVKQAITGYGQADKRQMQKMVALLLKMNEIPRPDDAADALAIAICYINSTRIATMIQEQGGSR
ncbi:MAG: crossover junction endodeoxyribonuclease RuvC [Anaerolineae bacterium]